MIRILFVTLLAISTLHNLTAQIPELDSLENVLQNHSDEDALKVDLLNEIALRSNRYDLAKTYDYSDKARVIAETLGYAQGKAESLRLIGEYYMRKPGPAQDSSLTKLKEALEIFEQIGNQRGMGLTYRSMGTCYFFLNNFYKSLQCSHASLKIFEQLGLKEEIANILTNIGSLHSIQHNSEEALEYYARALTIFNELGIKFKLAVCHFNISDLKIKTGDYADALINLEKSIAMLEELKLTTMIPAGLTLMGNIKKLQGDYPEALNCYNKSLSQSEKMGLNGTICDNYIGLAEVYFELNNYRLAKEYGEKGLALAKQLKILERQRLIYAVLPKIYEARRDFEKAYFYHQQYKTISDSLLNEENIKKLAGIEYQYEFDKDKQAILLEQQKKDVLQTEEIRRQKVVRNAFIIGFALVVLLIAVVSSSLIQKQKTNRKLLALNKSKDDIFSIIAHDLRAPVGNIKAFLELILSNPGHYDEKEVMKIIALLGTQSASVFNILENLLAWANSQRQNIVLNKELQPINAAIESNINLLKDSAKAKSISITSQGDTSIRLNYDLTLISTVVRNLIANAIKFTSNEGSIVVKLEEDDKFIRTLIIDTGLGIDTEKAKSLFDSDVFETTLGTNAERGSGLGLKLCHEFVVKHGGEIWVESEVGKGSQFIFTLPKNA